MEYFVYVRTTNELSCPNFSTLNEAIEKYKATPMETLKDDVCLGVQDGDSFCFDIVHKFFNENILINDYLNHPERKDELDEILKDINSQLFIKYQFTSDIMGGALIDYNTGFVPYDSMKVEEKWNEAHISTYRDGMEIVGWVKPNRDTWNQYGWCYQKTASYVSRMNVPVYDERGHRHDVDMDPRAYLSSIGKKVSTTVKCVL